jgi:hypothetical protein
MLGTSKSVFGFDPRSVGGCALWLDGADTASMTLSGSTVTQWKDKSINGYTGTPSGSPTLVTGSQNGLSCVNFVASSSQYFDFGNILPLTSAGITVFAVGKSTFVGGTNQTIVGKSLYGGQNGRWSLLQENTSIEFLIETSGGGALPTSPAAPYSGVFSLFEGAWNGSTAFLYANGSQLASTATTGTAAATANPVYVGAYQNSAANGPQASFYWNGTIGEILVFSSILTTAQRQAVEGYLAWKWGLETLATTSLPTSISSCVLWLDGADSTRTTNIATGTWLDKSGLGSNATSNAGGGAFSMGTMNGVSAVTFPTGSFGFTANTALATSTGITVFLVASTSTNRSAGSFFLSGNVGSFGVSMTGTVFPVAMRFTASGATAAITGNVVTTSPFIYSATSTSTDLNAWVNGTNNASGTANPALSITSLTIGNYATASSTYAFTGRMGEVIIYNRSLSTSERQFIEAYLGRKWNVQVGNVVLPITHPFYSIQPFARYFNPIDVPSCVLWLDAADSSTVTGTTTVTAWKDKSGNARDLGVGSGTTSYANGAITLATSYMFVNSAVNLTNFTFFIVVKSNTATNNQTVFGGRPNTSAIYNSTDGFGFYMDYQTSTRLYGQTSVGAQVAVNSLATSSPNIFAYTSGSTVINASINGAPGSGASSLSARTSTAQGFVIGAEWSGSAYVTNVGNVSIYEAIVYNVALTTAQRQAVEGYLAWKWGLSSSLPATGHSFSKFPASTAAQFNPATVTGCLLWLDGADSNATANITTGVWYDKSGLSSTATSNAGGGAFSMGTINTVPAVTFPAASVARLSASTAISTATGFSVFMVASMSALASSRTYLLSEGNLAYRVYASTTAFPTQVGTYVGAFFSSLTSPSLAVSTPFIYSATVGATQFNQWINGVVNTVTGTVTSFTGTTMNIGNYGAASSVYAFTGQMGEVIIYSGVVTIAQRQAVEGYLAWKWGLQTNLPTTHPFYKFAPGAVGY